MMQGLTLLQINLNHCRAAQQLMYQAAQETKADLVVVSEPYNVRDDWQSNDTGRAAVWCTATGKNKVGYVKRIRQEEGFVVVETKDVTLISCYLSPSMSMGEYTRQLSALQGAILALPKAKIVLGDFNAQSPAWGSDLEDRRGKLLLEMCIQSGLIPINSEGGWSFERRGKGSRIDAMLCDPSLANILTRSYVSDQATGSDHRYLIHEFSGQSTSRKRTGTRMMSMEPRLGRVNPERLEELVRTKLQIHATEEGIVEESLRTREGIDRRIKLIEEVVNMARSRLPPQVAKRKPVFWWNDDIAACRDEVRRARRALLRKRGKRSGRGATPEELTQASTRVRMLEKKLKTLIYKAKSDSWQELLDAVDSDPWGKPYKIIVKRLSAKTTVVQLDEERFTEAVNTLFVTEYRPEWSSGEQGAEVASAQPPTEAVIPLTGRRSGAPPIEQDTRVWITPSEVFEACKLIKCGKAPGPDEITGNTVRTICNTDLSSLGVLFNESYRQGYFPTAWKRGRLVLITKAGSADQQCRL